MSVVFQCFRDSVDGLEGVVASRVEPVVALRSE
jgi:hypothetical protein